MCWASGLAGVGEDRVRLKSLMATIPPNTKACFSVPCLDKSELIAAVSMVINFFPVRQEEAPGSLLGWLCVLCGSQLLLQNKALRACFHRYKD